MPSATDSFTAAGVRHLVIASLFVFASPSVRAADADAAPSPTETARAEVRQGLDEVQARLEILERAASESGRRELRLDEQRMSEIRELVMDVLADADVRASLLSQAATAGHDGGFFITSADGSFRLDLSGQIQVRYVLNHQKNARDDNDRSGFENRRAKIKLEGHAFDPRLEYSLTIALDSDDGVAGFEGVWVLYHVNDQFAVKLGRFRSPLLREESVSSKRQLAVERSLIQRAFKQSRTVGIGVTYVTDHVRSFLAVMDTSGDPLGDQNWLASTRVEALLTGDWKTLKDFSSFPDDEPVVALGAGVLYEDKDPIARDDPDATLVRWTGDVSIETGGATFFAAIVGNHVDADREPSRDQYGALGQCGFFLTDNWEIFGRYSWGEADGRAEELSVATIGVNRYVIGNDLKWSADIGYGFNAVQPFWSSSGAGWRRDRPGEEGQIVVRAQFQLLF